jgi:signal transduction histidine kinase
MHVRQQGPWVRLRVEDSGRGNGPALRERLDRRQALVRD